MAIIDITSAAHFDERETARILSAYFEAEEARCACRRTWQIVATVALVAVMIAIATALISFQALALTVALLTLVGGTDTVIYWRARKTLAALLAAQHP